MLINAFYYIFSFAVVWFGAGLIIGSIQKLTKKLGFSQFALSFIFLGVLTSTPEIAVGITSISENKPDVIFGNLIGGIPVLLLLVIPLFAIFANGINVKHDFDKKSLIGTLFVILVPSLLILDRRLTRIEGLISISAYLILIYFVSRKFGLFKTQIEEKIVNHKFSYLDPFKILLGFAIVYAASHVIVDKTLFFAEQFNISTFYVSLIVLSIGTNIPEFSIAARSIFEKSKDIAFGDYIGSAVVNTLLFGVSVVFNKSEDIQVGNFFTAFAFIFSSVLLIFLIVYKKGYISRNNGYLLIAFYIFYVVFELFLR